MSKRILNCRDPFAIAKTLIDDQFTIQGNRTIHWYQNSFHVWDGKCYRGCETEYFRKLIYEFLSSSFENRGPDADLRPIKPNGRLFVECRDALKAQCYIPFDLEAPFWIESSKARPVSAENIITFSNGLFNLENKRLMGFTPEYFSQFSLEFPYVADPPSPTNFLNFLKSVFDSDTESMDTLLEFFGYVISPSLAHQKILLVIGPPRSGKGTIARILEKLVGRDNTCSLSLNTIARQFGLQQLLGKRLAIIPDARLGKVDRSGIVVERLLSISGGDKIDVDIKHKPSVQTRSSAKIAIFTNEIPAFEDPSGALPSRFLVLAVPKSFLGCEDTELFSKIEPELSSIVISALQGLNRLNNRKKFTQPNSANEILEEISDVVSPISQFVTDCCQLGPDKSVPREVIYKAYREWSEEMGRSAESSQIFGKQLRETVTALGTTHKSHKEGKRLRYYRGISLLGN